MKPKHIVDELKRAAGQLGVRVRMDVGNFRGGRCVVGGEEQIVLNKRHTPEAHLVVLAESLRDLPVENVFLRPAVREALQEVWQRQDEGLTEDEAGFEREEEDA